jgi:methylenetetrahydrofolate reductase (NADPH)
VSAYPEKHPQSPSAGHDLDVLAGKVAAGARRAITQMCFDTEAVLRLRDRIEARRIDVELLPGVFPIHDFGAVSRFAARCGASIPHAIAARFRRIEHDLQATAHAGAELAAEQLDRFAAEGLAHAHLYTLNRAELVIDTLDRLTIKRLTRTRAA